MLPQLASLSFGGACRDEASRTILPELAQAAGGVLPLHTLRLNRVFSALAPIVGSLRKLSIDYNNYAKEDFASLLAHAHQLQELELRQSPPLGCAWVSASLQKLSLSCSVPHLRDVLYGDLPALREVEVASVHLPNLPCSEEGAAAVEVLHACLASLSVSYSIHIISLGDEEWEDEGEGDAHLQSWLRPLADMFADRTRAAACVEEVMLFCLSIDAGSIEGLASIFPAVKGEALMTLATCLLLRLPCALLLLQPQPIPTFGLWHRLLQPRFSINACDHPPPPPLQSSAFGIAVMSLQCCQRVQLLCQGCKP